MLESAGVSFRPVDYAVDESDLSAENMARKIGLPEERVYKTLAVRGNRMEIVLALIPTGAELSLKALASASGNKACGMLPLKEARSATGYVRGGVSLGTAILNRE